MLTNPCLCSVGCATIFVLFVEESLYNCDWCYIWTNAFCLFFYFIIIINFFCFFFSIKLNSFPFNRMSLVYKWFDHGKVRKHMNYIFGCPLLQRLKQLTAILLKWFQLWYNVVASIHHKIIICRLMYLADTFLRRYLQ